MSIIWYSSCFAPVLTITTGGLYTLGDDIFFAPGVADTAISIQASNVTLDLNGRSITQTDSTPNVDGITIAPNLTNISIKNGTIKNISRYGITHNGTGSNSIFIDKISCIGCQTGAISLIGTGATPLSNLTLSNCSCNGCGGRATADSIVRLEFLSQSNIQQLSILNTLFTGAGTRNGLLLANTTETTIRDLFISILNTTTPSGPSLINGISVTNSSLSNCFINIFINNIVSNDGEIRLFNIDSTSGQSIIVNALATASQTGSSGGSISGIFINGPNTLPWLIANCILQGANATVGITRTYNLNQVSNAVLIDCISHKCLSSDQFVSCDGFLFNSCTRSHLIRCNSINNENSRTQTFFNGIRFDTSTSCSASQCLSIGNVSSNPPGGSVRGFFVTNCTNCTLRGNSACLNIGKNNTSSAGFDVSPATNTGTNGCLENSALINGNSATNQFRSFGASQNIQQPVGSVNSVNQPFTNVGLY